MDKIIALIILLVPQPLVGYALWFSMNKLFEQVGLTDTTLNVVTLVCAAILYVIFCFFFARGFLGSAEAKKPGF